MEQEGCGYVRVSTWMQRHGGISFEAQEDLIRKELERRGYTVGRIYSDVESGGHPGRTGWVELLEAIRSRRWRAVCCWDLDRLHREMRSGEEFMEACLATFTEPISLCSPIDFASAAGRLKARIMGAFGVYQREHTGEQVRMTYRYMVESGSFGGGRVWYGYRTVNKQQLLDPEQAPWLLLMYEMYADGASTLDISRHLNLEGIPTQRGRKWTHNSVVKALRQTVQRGYRRFGDGVGPCPVAPIVPPELVARVDGRLEGRRRKLGPTVRCNVWAGIAVCRCGTAMFCTSTGSPERKRRYLACASRKTGVPCGVGLLRMGYANALADHLAAVLEPLEPDHPVVTGDDAAELVEIEALERDAADARFKLRSITQEYYEGLVSELRARRAKVRPRFQGAARVLPAWGEMDIATRSRTLRVLVDEAVWDGATLAVTLADLRWDGAPAGVSVSQDGRVVCW